ncbi:MAG: hypothetical protein ABJB33_07420, partial [Gemmatimonadota bacterium]
MPRPILLTAALLLLTGCGAGWHRTELTPETALGPRDQFLIHHGANVDRWHAVQVSEDSIAGIPWLKPADCDSCRLALPRASVDSIRLGHPAQGVWKTAGLILFGPPAILTLYCLL